MWLLKGRGEFADITGDLFEVSVVNGFALVGRWDKRRILTEKGFLDLNVEIPTLEALFGQRMSPRERILVVRHGGIGDSMMAVPVLRALRAKWPGVEVLMSARIEGHTTLKNLGLVDEFMTCKVTEIATYADQVDDVLDLTHSVEFNPRVTWRNAYEEACRQFDLEPASYLPELKIDPEEEEWAQDFLLDELGIRPWEPVIGMHIEATAATRFLPPLKGKAIATELALRGYKVLVFGDKPSFSKHEEVVCPKCSAKVGMYIPQGDRAAQACPKCKRQVRAKLTKVPPGVHFLRESREVDLRKQLVLLSKVHLLIGVDSGFAHAAGALGVPLLALFISHDARSRIGHFPKTVVLQVPFRCAPCHVNSGNCAPMLVARKHLPPCLEAYNVDEIVSTAVELMERPPRGKVAEIRGADTRINEKQPKPCPFCTTRASLGAVITRKGPVLYVRCPGCSSIHVHETPSTKFYEDPEYDDIYSDAELVEGMQDRGRMLADQARRMLPEREKGDESPLRVLDVGCNRGSILAGFLEKGWEVHGIDVADYSVEAARKLVPGGKFDRADILGGTANKGPKAVLRLSRKPKVAIERGWDAVICHHTLEHLARPIEALSRMGAILKDGGLLGIVCPDATQCLDSRATEWGHLNTYHAGEHLAIPSHQGIAVAAQATGMLSLVNLVRNEGQAEFLAWFRRRPEAEDVPPPIHDQAEEE